MRATLVSRTVFVASPEQGTSVQGFSYYVRKEGLELLGMHNHMRESDKRNAYFLRRSLDNGRTWSEQTALPFTWQVPQGRVNRSYRPGFLDPFTGRLISYRSEGWLPRGNPFFYTVSEDGGVTNIVDEQIIQAGGAYTTEHPLPMLWTGKNGLMSAGSSVPIALRDGTILIPCQVQPTDENHEPVNPTGGYTYHDAVVLRGRWRADKHIDWEASAPVKGDPERSTRGMIEPTLGELADGRVLMVMRGSNDRKPSLPSYRWYSNSEDKGKTWSTPAPWTYDDGTSFFSPSSSSQLLLHSSGTLVWFGNTSPKNMVGGTPRYPLIIGEVDRETGLLKRETVTVIDTKGPEDTPALQLSNFYAREDRATGEIVLHMTRLFAKKERDWTSDALEYRIKIN